jgi:polar amino acid transport system substrate-binding protein
MKKILTLILALAMIAGMVALTACSEKKTATADTAADTKKSEATDTASGSAEAKATDTEAKSDEKAKLIMATNAYFPPYEYYEGDEIIGIDAEVAAAIAEKLDMELVIEDMEFNSILAAVQSGKADMGMAGMTVTEERLESVNFSTSYAKGVQVVIVKEDSDIASPDDLAGKLIGVQLSTTGDIYASDDFGEDNVEKYSKGAEAVVALTQGKVDAVIIDNEPAKAFVAANEGLKILETSYADEDYAICFAKENTELLEKVNAALDELIKDGTLQSIIDKYIPA